MVCDLLELSPTVIPINPNKKNKEFLNIISSGRLPALVYGKEEPYTVIDESPEVIVEFLDNLNQKIDPDPRRVLKSTNKAALGKRNAMNTVNTTIAFTANIFRY